MVAAQKTDMGDLVESVRACVDTRHSMEDTNARKVEPKEVRWEHCQNSEHCFCAETHAVAVPLAMHKTLSTQMVSNAL